MNDDERKYATIGLVAIVFGAVALVAGAWMIWRPLSFILFGLMLIAYGFCAMDLSKKAEKKSHEPKQP